MFGAIYAHRGYQLEPRGGAHPDGGIDHVIHKNGERWLIKCKHWRGEDVGVTWPSTTLAAANIACAGALQVM